MRVDDNKDDRRRCFDLRPLKRIDEENVDDKVLKLMSFRRNNSCSLDDSYYLLADSLSLTIFCVNDGLCFLDVNA